MLISFFVGVTANAATDPILDLGKKVRALICNHVPENIQQLLNSLGNGERLSDDQLATLRPALQRAIDSDDELHSSLNGLLLYINDNRSNNVHQNGMVLMATDKSTINFNGTIQSEIPKKKRR